MTTGDPGTGPNILLLCTDQQRFDALGAAGNDLVHTPNLDALAAQGARFSHCVVQSPVCAPSRGSLMTGQYVHAHGLWANGVTMPPGRRLVTESLAESGYTCDVVGKWHLAACIDGRTEQVPPGVTAFRWAHDPYPGSSENAYHRHLRAAHPDVWAQVTDPGSGMGFDTVPTRAHYSRWVADEAIELLGTRTAAGDRFFLVANFFDPHHGFGAPEEYRQRYRDAALPPLVGRPGELADKPAILAEASQRSYAGHAKGFAEYTDAELRDAREAYYAMVTLVDDEVGRILAALEETGAADDTLVVFTSDHGEMLGDHRLMLKGPMMYDCAIRVPLLVRWPRRIPRGVVIEDLVQWIDLTSTFVDAAGAAASPSAQGRSLLGLIDGTAAPRGWALAEYRDSGHPYDPPVRTTMLRTDTHKLVVHHAAGDRGRDGELYDLVEDPHELTNLYHRDEAAEIRRELTDRLVDALVDTEDRSAPRLGYW